uniref:Uncharacterized protein n=1 Tax=Anguilla anguilla TaxID=7936 RepID=A0A0E9Q3T2_ANGAN
MPQEKIFNILREERVMRMSIFFTKMSSKVFTLSCSC